MTVEAGILLEAKSKIAATAGVGNRRSQTAATAGASLLLIAERSCAGSRGLQSTEERVWRDRRGATFAVRDLSGYEANVAPRRMRCRVAPWTEVHGYRQASLRDGGASGVIKEGRFASALGGFKPPLLGWPRSGRYSIPRRHPTMMWALRARWGDAGELERSDSRACETPAETWGNSVVPWGQITALQYVGALRRSGRLRASTVRDRRYCEQAARDRLSVRFRNIFLASGGVLRANTHLSFPPRI
jgi:hypothetical protein